MDIEAVIDAVTKFLDDDAVLEMLVDIVDADVLLDELGEVAEDEIKQYTCDHYDCDDVYDDTTLNNWWHENNEILDHVDWSDVSCQVAENHTPDELYGSEYIQEYFINNYEDDWLEGLNDNDEPEDVYTPEQLAAWAEENGYKKVEVVDESN